MKAWGRWLLVSLVGIPAVVACSADRDPPRGGVVVTVRNDGSLDIDRLKVEVTKDDGVLLRNEVTVPDTPLPNTLSIVSNGTGTATATIVISAWKGGVPIDRRDAIITQIPSDRVASLPIVLSARCTPLVRVGSDPAVAESLCATTPELMTCDPTATEPTCKLATVDASTLPDYVPVADGTVGPDDPNNPIIPTDTDGGAPAGCQTDDECAGPLDGTTPKDCATATCDPSTKKCVYKAKDKDGDGILPVACSAPGIAIETGTDCDDNDKNVHPGAWDGPLDSSDPTRGDSCEGKDNDCNGKIDDSKSAANLPCTCTPGDTRACSATADGTPITYPTGNPLGICTRGSQTCGADAQWGACNGAVAPTTRNCASVDDNDCDGAQDNVIDGVCKCTPGSTQSCFPYAAPAKAGAGPCKAGTQTCVAGSGSAAFGSCSGATGPQGADTCVSGNDNNCNGTKNEGCTCLNGSTQSCAGPQCGTGTQTCSNGAWGACQNIVGSAASCPAPSGYCSGTKACNGGTYGACTGVTPTYCRGGYTASGSECVRTSSPGITMRDDAGGDNYNFGNVSIDFTVYGSVTSSVYFERYQGGCWDGSSLDGIQLACTALNRSMSQCDSGASTAGCGATVNTGSSTTCNFHKIKGWTPPGQGTCVRHATMTFTDHTPKGCY